MKKITSLLMVLLVVLSLCSCGGGSGSGNGGSKTVLSNDYVTIEGIYVDESYVDKDGSPLKMVYVFFDVNAKDKNIKVDSTYLEMKINEQNEYSSSFYKNTCEFAPSYYYSSFIEDVYVGNNIKLIHTFKVPEGDLEAGKSITFSDFDLPVNDLKASTSDIIFCANAEEVCKKADPTGYAAEADKHAPADSATVTKLRNEMNGYYWSFYMTVGTSVQAHEIEFFAPNKFEVRSSLGSNSGTYEVKKAYIYVTYSSNNATYKIPYEFKNGELNLYCEKAFNIYE